MGRFVQVYGAGMWINTAWPTEDNIIPWRMFLFLFERMDVAWARQNLEWANSIMAALVNVMGTKDGPGQKILREMALGAFPEEVD